MRFTTPLSKRPKTVKGLSTLRINCGRSGIHGLGSLCPEGICLGIMFLMGSQSIL